MFLCLVGKYVAIALLEDLFLSEPSATLELQTGRADVQQTRMGRVDIKYSNIKNQLDAVSSQRSLHNSIDSLAAPVLLYSLIIFK